MKKTMLTTSMVFAVFVMHGQNAVDASGGDAGGRGGKASYSVGQVDYIADVGTNASSFQGVQHAYEIFELKEENVMRTTLAFTAFPNPAKDLVTIKADGAVEGVLSYKLFSGAGQLLSEDLLTDRSTTILMKGLPQGMYFIKLSVNNEPIKTFKILKN
jgi:hypothetical protein